MKKIKIAFFVENNLGHQTHLSLIKTAASKDPDIEPMWAPIEPYEPDLWSKIPGIRHQTPLCWSLRTASKLHEMHQSLFKADVIYFHTINVALWQAIRSEKIPWAVSLDGSPEPALTFIEYRKKSNSSGIKMKMREWLYRNTLTSACSVIGFSSWVSESVRRHYGVPEERILTIPTGVRTAFWSESRSRRVRQGLPTVVFVGNDFERKGGGRLVRIWMEKLRERCSLILVSKTAPPELSGIEGIRVVRQIGHEQLRELLACASIMALPTLADALPFVVMEAMASGLAVLSTRVGGIPSMVEHGRSGYLIDPGDDTALERTLIGMLDNPRLVESMGQRGLEIARERFDAESNYRRLLDHLKGLARMAPMAAGK